MKLEQIKVWRDEAFREPALEMALDHALLDHSILKGDAIARFYAWNAPAVTVGYFHQIGKTETESISPVRRYTGGGLVEHGEDVTFALIFPSGSVPANASSASRYQWIHAELAKALRLSGFITTRHEESFQNGESPCFQHAVSEDLIDPVTGSKICGGAQRRCKGTVIHQGSIRLPESYRDLNSPWIEHFLNSLAATQSDLSENEKTNFTARAIRIRSERYGTEGWNLQRKEQTKIKF